MTNTPNENIAPTPSTDNQATSSNPPNYLNFSRGHKTKGNSYKDRYVQLECPECGNMSAYKDEWHTKISYKCLRRKCRHNWFVDKEFPNKDKPE